LSVAATTTETFPNTVLPEAGEVMLMVGAVVSTALLTLTDIEELREFPAAS
jgi:hypothetical protein